MCHELPCQVQPDNTLTSCMCADLSIPRELSGLQNCVSNAVSGEMSPTSEFKSWAACYTSLMHTSPWDPAHFMFVDAGASSGCALLRGCYAFNVAGAGFEKGHSFNGSRHAAVQHVQAQRILGWPSLCAGEDQPSTRWVSPLSDLPGLFNSLFTLKDNSRKMRQRLSDQRPIFCDFGATAGTLPCPIPVPGTGRWHKALRGFLYGWPPVAQVVLWLFCAQDPDMLVLLTCLPNK